MLGRTLKPLQLILIAHDARLHYMVCFAGQAFGASIRNKQNL